MGSTRGAGRLVAMIALPVGCALFLAWLPGQCLKHSDVWLRVVAEEEALAESLRAAEPAPAASPDRLAGDPAVEVQGDGPPASRPVLDGSLPTEAALAGSDQSQSSDGRPLGDPKMSR